MVFPFFLIFAVSLLLCSAIILLGRAFPNILMRHDRLFSRQRIHDAPTPRFGGLAIFLSLLISLYFVAPSLTSSYREFLIATSILFIVAFVEDLTGRVPPLLRLAAAIFASAVFIIWNNVWLPRIGIEFIDPIFQNMAVGLIFTSLLVAGISNGFNMVDGVNGLSAFTGLSASLSLFMISYLSGFDAMKLLTLSLAAAIAGFLVLNFPKARIFMGDAGAYVIGFVLAWFGVSILIDDPAVSPWAILLALFWPFAEVAMTFTRRLMNGRPTMHPDRMHLHQIVMRVIEIRILKKRNRAYANPLTTYILLPLVLACEFFSIMFWNKNGLAFLAFIVLMAAFYFASYRAVKFGSIRNK